MHCSRVNVPPPGRWYHRPSRKGEPRLPFLNPNPATRRSVFERKPVPDLIRDGGRFALRKRVKKKAGHLAAGFGAAAEVA